MNIIIPMAGLGSRFASSGFTLPKPLIQVAGKAMYRHAVDCLPLELASKLVFILRQSDFVEDLKNDIETFYQGPYKCEVLTLDHDTRGQAETVLKSADLLDLNVPSLVHNCDTYISPNISWQHMISQNTDGILVLFDSQEQRWSYAKLNDQNTKIIDVQEKKVISRHASSGTYYFKNTISLLDNIQKIIQQDYRENGEYYLSTVYRLMIDQQLYLSPIWSDPMLCFGTPQDLVHSLNKILLNDSLKKAF
ncbi:MAG: sugar phosphate nucleotidyltransferase [Janthinobacterium lividum]